MELSNERAALVRAQPDPRRQRWEMLRDLVVFQAKLGLDGLKDVVLAPFAIVFVAFGLLFRREDPGRSLYQLMRLGDAFDRWVNLYAPVSGQKDASGLDAQVKQLEALLVERSERGELTGKAKVAVDNALDALAQITSTRRPPEPDSTTHRSKPTPG